ncbi:MAG TPA: glycosyl hydrolase family 18 protein [Bacilli bacterium]
MITAPRSQPGKSIFNRVIFYLFMLVLGMLIVLGGLLYYLNWNKGRPNTEYLNPLQQFNGLPKPILYQGEMMPFTAIGEQEALKIPFDTVKSFLDPAILFEETTQSVIVTTKDKVLRLKTGQLTGMMNERPFDLRFSVEKQEETIYLPTTPLLDYYAVELREIPETGVVWMIRAGDALQWGAVAADPRDPDAAVQEEGQPEPSVPMRSKPSIKAPIYADLSYGTEIIIWEETDDGWYRIQLDNGYMGFAEKAHVQFSRIEVIPSPAVKPPVYVPWKPSGGKINLTWEHVVKKTADSSKLGGMNGLNVVSPTWFHLTDGEGNINNLADPTYVKWAHARGLQIWGLFSNGFNPDWTTEALATYDKRMKMVKQLLAYADSYNLQGINIDFENMYLKDQANLTQFVRELTPLLHEQGLVVSIDVTIRGGSEMWSLFADRSALGEVVDYMMVMTYDEHWATSPTAGSVASLPWVEKGILAIMEEDGVPASKLVLGVPYYTRIWTEQTVDGKTSVTSKAVSMETVDSIIEKYKLTPLFLPDMGQHYVEYTEDGKVNKIWIEDEVSMKARVELVKKHHLAGVASWRRGFETPDIWNLIAQELETKP